VTQKKPIDIHLNHTSRDEETIQVVKLLLFYSDWFSTR